MDEQTRIVFADNMKICYDVPIPMDDGIVLRADVFAPEEDGKYPVIITYGPYGKGLPFEGAHYNGAWMRMKTGYPEIMEGTSTKYANWETVDPEKWVPDGYVCVRVDSRGSGRSPGYMDLYSDRQSRDYYQCIEWAAEQPWSTGKIGLLGISYYAMIQWKTASMCPPHLSAMCTWEGSSDYYREFVRHGGILNTFTDHWEPPQVKSIQHGKGENGYKNPNTGEWVSGPETLTEEELAKNRPELDMARAIQFPETADNPWFVERRIDLTRIKAPLLSAGSWGANHIHTRGNIEGYIHAGSEQKWLEMHGLEHFTEFYTNYGVTLQKRFFNHFLKGMDTWSDQPPVSLRLRNVDGTFTTRAEQEWPIARTQWTKLYLNAEDLSLSTEKPEKESEITFAARGDGLNFWLPVQDKPVEITGPAMSKLFISSDTEDADMFLQLRVIAPDGKEVTFISADDARGFITMGWLRASHRKLDVEKSLPYRPYHTHDELQPLTPGETYELDIEIIPTSVIVPPGYKIGLYVGGKDYQLPEEEGPFPIQLGEVCRGHGASAHEDKLDRDHPKFNGNTTLYTGGEKGAYLLLPIIPNEE